MEEKTPEIHESFIRAKTKFTALVDEILTLKEENKKVIRI
jgi:hypothetical protein